MSNGSCIAAQIYECKIANMAKPGMAAVYMACLIAISQCYLLISTFEKPKAAKCENKLMINFQSCDCKILSYDTHIFLWRFQQIRENYKKLN